MFASSRVPLISTLLVAVLLPGVLWQTGLLPDAWGRAVVVLGLVVLFAALSGLVFAELGDHPLRGLLATAILATGAFLVWSMDLIAEPWNWGALVVAASLLTGALALQIQSAATLKLGLGGLMGGFLLALVAWLGPEQLVAVAVPLEAIGLVLLFCGYLREQFRAPHPTA